MSRCFPYPPPGFIEKKASDALIDSIKLQKEKKSSKEQRKEKRKEKKEKKDKKREKKEKEGTFPKPTEVVHGSQKDIKELLEFKEGHSLKRKLEDIEQLEGSSVTEEHGQPLNLQNPSYSSDSTQNSNKRRKQAPSDSRGHGNIIRIKLPLQKHKELEITVSKQLQNRESDVSAKELLCSIAGRTEIQKQQICSIPGRSFSSDSSAQDVGTSGKEDSLRCDPTSGLGCSTSGKDEVAQDDKRNKLEPVPQLCLTSREKKMLKKDLQYTNLVENLYQMAMPSQLADNDDEWLFGGKSVDKFLNKSSVEKQFAVSTDVTCSGSSSLYPCARYLKEAEIYALPYTVPF